MPSYRYHTADVFTDVPFGGNQLAVFPDARGIPEHRLLDVTREFNYSETTFVYPSASPAHTRQVRIFTPGGEVPFAGHPKVGPVPVRIRAEQGRPVFAQLSVAKLPELGPVPPAIEGLAEVLGLAGDDLLGGEWQPQALSCGLPFLFVPVRSLDAVARARVKLDPWERILKGTWAPELFVFARGGERPGTDFHARMFAPGISVPEDPATGSANAALAGYLAARDSGRDGTLRWRVEQGFEMGRPSILEVEADRAGSAVTAVRVGGASVMVCSGSMEIS
jgi:trans-2,3-dihydro-3-hydroxyanthranilate isomerase